MPFLIAALGLTAVGAVLTARRMYAAPSGTAPATSTSSQASQPDTSGVARAQADLRAALTGAPDFSTLLNPQAIRPNFPATPNLMPSFDKVVEEIHTAPKV